MPNFIESLAYIKKDCWAIFSVFEGFEYDIGEPVALMNCRIALTGIQIGAMVSMFGGGGG